MTSMENDVGEINIPRDERDAIKAIDNNTLDKLIDQCLDEQRTSCLRPLQLDSCGLHVASNLHKYEGALAEYRVAKAAKKRSETESRARRAGSELAHAVHQMKHRVEADEKEEHLFYVDDQILPPYRLGDRLTVRVTYRWRATIADKWEHGSITFSHDVDSRPDYTIAPRKRKPSASKQAQDRQEALYREWEHLMRLGLYSVRGYFQKGGNPTAIPESFQTKTDGYSRGLNNFSADFWSVPPSDAK